MKRLTPEIMTRIMHCPLFGSTKFSENFHPSKIKKLKTIYKIINIDGLMNRGVETSEFIFATNIYDGLVNKYMQALLI